MRHERGESPKKTSRCFSLPPFHIRFANLKAATQETMAPRDSDVFNFVAEAFHIVYGGIAFENDWVTSKVSLDPGPEIYCTSAS